MKPTDLPRPALLFANHSQLVFRRAAQLYDVLIERFSKLEADEGMFEIFVNKIFILFRSDATFENEQKNL